MTIATQPRRSNSPAPEDAPRRPAARAAEAPLFTEPTQPPADPPAPVDPPAEKPPVRTLNEAHAGLCKPFAMNLVELKPGAMNQDKSRALAMPFVDLRAYHTRLDRVVGPEGWSHTYQLTARGVVCALSICGITKSAIGDFPLSADDENAATSAEAQSFKRACAAFGLGRYLYSLPQIWGDYDREKKRFVDPGRIVRQMYDNLHRESD